MDKNLETTEKIISEIQENNESINLKLGSSSISDDRNITA